MASRSVLVDPADGTTIDRASHARALFEAVFEHARVEHFQTAFLDRGFRLLALEGVEGICCDSITCPVRPILVRALELGAEALLVAHNHPLGDPMPSRADLAATRTLAHAAATLGIRLVDRLVFAGTRCRSFRELGLL